MPRIVIAGGGIAGLEALVALRAHLGPQAEIQLLEANAELVERQRAVVEPFDATKPRQRGLAYEAYRAALEREEHTALLHSVWTHRLRVAEC